MIRLLSARVALAIAVGACSVAVNAAPVKQTTAAILLAATKAKALQGDATAQFNLGLMYAQGRGVAQDYAAAFNWYRKAADQGSVGAQNNLGVMYEQGKGVVQDYVQAHKWFNLAGANAKDIKNRDAAAANRDIVAAKMQPAQIAEAQRLANAWRRK